MSPLGRRVSGLTGGLGVTALLLLFLLLGTVTQGKPEKPALRGAIRLSSIEEAPVNEEETYSTRDVPQVEPLEQTVSMEEVSMEEPRMEMDMPSMDLELAPELAGTLPMSGLASLAEPGALAAPGGGALTLGEVDEQPRPIYAPLPMYPAREKALGKEVKVLVRIKLDRDGRVVEATPLELTDASRPFHEAAVQTVLQWRFVPCKKGNESVQCIADQPFAFSIAR